MSVQTTFNLTVNTIETLTTNVPAAVGGGNTLTHGGFNTALTLNATSTPPATECAYFEQALSSGAATIDLRALTGSNGRAIDLNGLKVQVFKVKAKASNANPITVTVGASNGYLLAGSAWKVILQPGQEFVFSGNAAAPAVGASAKTIDLSGTGTQSVEVAVIAG